MRNRIYPLMVLIFMGGILGGALSDWILTERTAVAETASVGNWGDEPARITKAEYLDLFLCSRFRVMVVSRSSTSFASPHFFPSEDPDTAVFVIYQKMVFGRFTPEREQRRLIQEHGRLSVGIFEVLCSMSAVGKRWVTLKPPRNRIIIHYVQVKDRPETLAVTMDGVTSFDIKDFEEAENRVKMAGGVWGL